MNSNSIKKDILKILGFNKSKSLKNASILISGSSISQVISIVTAPIITRIYNPVDYGLLGIYMMVSSIIGVVSTMQYHTAIVVEKDDIIASRLVLICLRICVIISFIITIPIFFFNSEICRLLGDANLSFWLYLMPITVLLTGAYNTFLCWANRQLMFNAMSFSRVFAAITTPVFSILIGYFISGPLGLFTGLIIGQSISAIFLGKKIFRTIKWDRVEYSKTAKGILKKYNAFLRFSMPGELINTIVSQLPLFVLAKYFSTEIAGHYNLGNRLLSMPSQIISQSIGEIFRQKASEDYNTTGNCKRIFIKTFFSLGAISIVPFSILIIWSPEIFSFFFGKEWTLAGRLVRILSIIYVLRFVISPLTFVCLIVRKNYVSLIGTVYYAISSIVLSIVLIKSRSSVFTFLWTYVINFASVYIIMLLFNYKFSKGNR